MLTWGTSKPGAKVASSRCVNYCFTPARAHRGRYSFDAFASCQAASSERVQKRIECTKGLGDVRVLPLLASLISTTHVSGSLDTYVPQAPGCVGNNRGQSVLSLLTTFPHTSSFLILYKYTVMLLLILTWLQRMPASDAFLHHSKISVLTCSSAA